MNGWSHGNTEEDAEQISPEVRALAARMVQERRGEHGSKSPAKYAQGKAKAGNGLTGLQNQRQ